MLPRSYCFHLVQESQHKQSVGDEVQSPSRMEGLHLRIVGTDVRYNCVQFRYLCHCAWPSFLQYTPKIRNYV
jgi:hypothetical protein